jgi:hypothetical protein
MVLAIAQVACGDPSLYTPTRAEYENDCPYGPLDDEQCPWDPYRAYLVINRTRCYEDNRGYQGVSYALREFIHMGLHPDADCRATLDELAATDFGRAALAARGWEEGDAIAAVPAPDPDLLTLPVRLQLQVDAFRPSRPMPLQSM